MSTMIKNKDTGTWVTVAGGYRMWVGTKAALQAGIAAGKIPNGTAAMVTDDYENNSIATAQVTNLLSVPMSLMTLERYGKVVKASLRWYKDPLDSTISLPGDTPVCSIPDGFKPVDDGRSLPLGIQWNALSYTPVQFYMLRDGIMKNGNNVSFVERADLYIDAVWMTNDDWPTN